MIFRFLRQYLKDDEFEQNRLELAETKKLLVEYKEFILHQKNEEKEHVDSDFLTLIWASIAVAIAFGADTINRLPDKKVVFDSPVNAIRSVLALASAVFILINLFAALDLTTSYANSKSDKRVRIFAFTLIIGVSILVLGLIVISILNSLGL